MHQCRQRVEWGNEIVELTAGSDTPEDGGPIPTRQITADCQKAVPTITGRGVANRVIDMRATSGMVSRVHLTDS